MLIPYYLPLTGRDQLKIFQIPPAAAVATINANPHGLHTPNCEQFARNGHWLYYGPPPEMERSSKYKNGVAKYIPLK
jgi:hypothetical protein